MRRRHITREEVFAFCRAFLAARRDPDWNDRLVYREILNPKRKRPLRQDFDVVLDAIGAISDGLDAFLTFRAKESRTGNKNHLRPSPTTVPAGWHYFDLEFRPRVEAGSDWNKKRPILIRKGKKQLWIWPSLHSEKNGTKTMRVHIADYTKGGTRYGGENNHEVLEGRMTPQALRSVIDRLREFFEEPRLLPEHIQRNFTLVIPEKTDA